MQFSIYFSRARKNAFYSPLMVFVNRHPGYFSLSDLLWIFVVLF